MLKEFKEFILRGNLVDLAVAVIIGIAFGALVDAFVKELITPLIALVGGEPDFSGYNFDVSGTEFGLGDFVNELIAFVTVAAVVFFFVVKPVNALMTRRKVEPATDVPTRECPECMSEIPGPARRCAFCTAQVPPAG